MSTGHLVLGQLLYEYKRNIKAQGRNMILFQDEKANVSNLVKPGYRS